MTEQLIMEARMKDFVTGNVDKIIASIKGIGPAAEQTERRVNSANDKIAQKMLYNQKQVVGLVRSYIGFTAVLGTLKGIQKALSDTVDKYEEWGKITDSKLVKQHERLNQEYERMQITVGQKLYPMFHAIDQLKFNWLSGVSLLLDKLKVFQTPTQIAIGINDKVIAETQKEIDRLSQSMKFMTGDATAKQQMKNLQEQLAYARQTAPKNETPQTIAELNEQKQRKEQWDKYYKDHIDEVDKYGKVLSETERKWVKDAELRNSEWVKGKEDADALEAKIMEDKRKAIEEDTKFQDERNAELYNNRTAREDALTKKKDEETKKRIAIDEMELSATEHFTGSMINLGSKAISATRKDAREQQRIAVATAMVQSQLAAIFAIAKVWQTTESWVSGLIESIAIEADVIATGIALTSQMRSQSFASGTRNAPGGIALVGEQGPELMHVPKGAEIFTNTQTNNLMGGMTFSPVINISGNATKENIDNAVDRLQSLAQDIYSMHRQRLMRWDMMGIAARTV